MVPEGLPTTRVRNRSIVGRTPSSWSWDTQDWSDRETFDRMTYAARTGPKPVNSDCIHSVTFKHMVDGWDASGESPPVSSGSTFHATIILAAVSRCKCFKELVGIQKI